MALWLLWKNRLTVTHIKRISEKGTQIRMGEEERRAEDVGARPG